MDHTKLGFFPLCFAVTVEGVRQGGTPHGCLLKVERSMNFTIVSNDPILRFVTVWAEFNFNFNKIK